MYHLGNPCIHCGAPHDDVEPGACPKATGMAATVRNVEYVSGLLSEHEKSAAAETARLRKIITDEKTKMLRFGDGLDLDKIALAETFVHATNFSHGGSDGASVIADAVKWFATGKRVGTNPYYGNLRDTFFGTKNYDRWSGQRCDCEYGMGPTHGSICFQVGLKQDARKRDLTDEECEAAIYYLTNLARIQKAKVAA